MKTYNYKQEFEKEFKHLKQLTDKLYQKNLSATVALKGKHIRLILDGCYKLLDISLENSHNFNLQAVCQEILELITTYKHKLDLQEKKFAQLFNNEYQKTVQFKFDMERILKKSRLKQEAFHKIQSNYPINTSDRKKLLAIKTNIKVEPFELEVLDENIIGANSDLFLEAFRECYDKFQEKLIVAKDKSLTVLGDPKVSEQGFNILSEAKLGLPFGLVVEELIGKGGE